MPEYLRSLVVILLIAAVVFRFAKDQFTATLISPTDYDNRVKGWYIDVVIAFLAHNYWVYSGLIALVLYFRARMETNKVALYMFLMLALPHMTQTMPLFGLVGALMQIDYVKVLTLALLLPECLRLRRRNIKLTNGIYLLDKLVVFFIFLNLFSLARVDTLSGVIRGASDLLVDIVIPYYAITRGLETRQQLTDAIASYVLGALVISALGVFEFFKHWLLFSNLGSVMGLPYAIEYLDRGGIIRATSTSEQPIVLGLVVAVAFILYLYISKDFLNKKKYYAGLTIFSVGVIAPVSKGPWVGLFFGLLIIWLWTLNKSQKIKSLSFIGGVIFFAVALGYSDVVISFLPFIGTQDVGSTTYRLMLLDVAQRVISDNFWFGAWDYQSFMGEAKNGAGLVDIVNSYLQIILSTGVLGLITYISIFIGCLALLVRHYIKAKVSLTKDMVIPLAAAMLCLVITISMVSTITQVINVIWMMVGFCLACVGLDERLKVVRHTGVKIS